jgi:hypothetical protein
MPDQHLIRGRRIRALLRKASVVVVSASPRDRILALAIAIALMSRLSCPTSALLDFSLELLRRECSRLTYELQKESAQ